MRHWYLLLIAALAVSLPSLGWAHSLDGLEADLKAREKYFQPISRPAPAVTLKDASGSVVTSADLHGKVVVLHFIYASCTDVCPLHAEKLAEVQDMINQTPMRETVVFVSITTDPVRDTPEVLRAYGPAHGLDPANWMFLTSGADAPEGTRRLASAFGHEFTSTAGGEQVHGVVTHVIDANGMLRANFHGLQFNPTSLVLYVNALVNDPHPPEPPQPSLLERLRAFFL